jgi:hypothetical protein
MAIRITAYTALNHQGMTGFDGRYGGTVKAFIAVSDLDGNIIPREMFLVDHIDRPISPGRVNVVVQSSPRRFLFR